MQSQADALSGQYHAHQIIDSTHNGIGDSRKLSLFLRHIRVTAPRLRLHIK